MTWFKSLSNIFLGAVILVLGIWLFFEKCSPKKPAVSEKVNTSFDLLKEQTRLRDSAFSVQQRKDQQHKADSAKWKRKNDSATVQLNIANWKLNESQATVTELVQDLDAAYEEKDSGQFVVKCLQLKDSVKTLNARVDDYEHRVDTLVKAKDSLQLVTQKRLETNQNLVAQMRSSQLKSDSTVEAMKVAVKKAVKKADKKYAIGVGGCAGITNYGTPGGAVGITVSRTIIRF